MDSLDKPNPAQMLHNKAKAALALGEIYEANIQIRKALELDANDANIALAKEIKYEMGKKALAKAQQYFDKQRFEDARDEAQKALQAMEVSAEAEAIIEAIDKQAKKSNAAESEWRGSSPSLCSGASEPRGSITTNSQQNNRRGRKPKIPPAFQPMSPFCKSTHRANLPAMPAKRSKP